jgi:hypothetical protein
VKVEEDKYVGGGEKGGCTGRTEETRKWDEGPPSRSEWRGKKETMKTPISQSVVKFNQHQTDRPLRIIQTDSV